MESDVVHDETSTGRNIHAGEQVKLFGPVYASSVQIADARFTGSDRFDDSSPGPSTTQKEETGPSGITYRDRYPAAAAVEYRFVDDQREKCFSFE